MKEAHPSLATYWIVFVVLVVLLGVTILIAEIKLPEDWMNLALAMSIAAFKAVLIMLFFMHLWYRTAIIRIVAVAGIVWAFIGASLTLADYFTRGWHEAQQPRVNVERVDRETGQAPPQLPAALESPAGSTDGPMQPQH